VPILQGMKILRDNISDRRIKARITKALNYKPNTASVLPPVQP